MADFIPGQRVFHQGEEVNGFITAGETSRFAFGQAQQILPALPFAIYGMTEARMVSDGSGRWFEFGWTIDLSGSGWTMGGNSAAGWTDSGNYLRMEIEYSTDLQTWSMGKFVPAAVPVVDLGSGCFEFWSRCSTPVIWETVMVDFTAETNRYGKSITGITLKKSAVSLPRYPYSMPAQAATLQADLRAAGYTGAAVTSSAADMTVGVKNHTPGGAIFLPVTMAGANVTGVSYQRSPITSGMSYPYAMPAARATLQTHLRAAGFSGAVVMLFDDPWTITLPDVSATGTVRDFILSITPGDPYPAWDFFGNYLGEQPATAVAGSSGNVRDPAGNPLSESPRGFARLRISPGTRYDPYR